MTERRDSYDFDDLLACGRGELFGPGNAQLPLPPMLMFDRITNITETGGEHGKGRIVAELDVNPDLWFFACHFKGDPVMPGCLGLDALWQMLGFFLGWLGSPGRGRALGVGEIKFTGMVVPKREAGRIYRGSEAGNPPQACAGYRRRSAQGRRHDDLYRERLAGGLVRRDANVSMQGGLKQLGPRHCRPRNLCELWGQSHETCCCHRNGHRLVHR